MSFVPHSIKLNINSFERRDVFLSRFITVITIRCSISDFVVNVMTMLNEKAFFLLQHGTVATSSETSVGTQPGGSVTSRTASETPQVPSSAGSSSHHHHTGAKFRHGLLQLMIHTIDPLHDGQYEGIISNDFLFDV